MGVTRTLAKEIASARYGGVPAAAMVRIERLLIDHIGVAVMGQCLTGSVMAASSDDMTKAQYSNWGSADAVH